MRKAASAFLFPLMFILGCSLLAAGSVAAAEPAATTEPFKATEPVRPGPFIKIGYVDMAKIAAESVAGKKTQTKLKEKKDKLQAQISTREKQLDKQKAALEGKIKTLPPPQQEAKAKEFQKKIGEFQKFVKNSGMELQKSEDELVSQMFQAIEKAAFDYGKTSGFVAIVMKKELLYVGSGVEPQDVTTEIIRLLDDSSKGKSN